LGGLKMTFVPRHDIDLVHLHGALELDLGAFASRPSRRLDVIARMTSSSESSSWAI